MQRWIRIAIVSLAILTWMPTHPVLAQDATPSADSVKVGNRYYRKKTVVNFGNDTIQGDLTRPDGEYIEARRNVKLGRLIKLRENWKKRIEQAVNDL